jgi:hypothetical protein
MQPGSMPMPSLFPAAQQLQELPLAAADLDDLLPTDVVVADQTIDELPGPPVEGRREVLRLFEVRRALVERHVEPGVRDEPAGGAETEERSRGFAFTAPRGSGPTSATVERPALQPLPPEDLPFFSSGERTVHTDGHAKSVVPSYPVPFTLLGQKVRVRWDAHLVRVF